MAQVSLAFCGTFDVHRDDRPVTDFRSAKARALLAYLAVEADRPHQRAYLAGLLWPEWPEAAARTYLRQALNNLQQILGDKESLAPLILATPTTLQFNPQNHCRLDVALLTAALTHLPTLHAQRLPPETVECIQQTMALYRGPLLAGFSLPDCAEFEQWLLLTRERLQRQVLTALQLLADTHEQQGNYEQAHQCAWRCLELEPTAEEAHCRLMRLLACRGQRGAALRQFEQCRTILAEEIGVAPETQTVALYEKIRTQAVTGRL